MSLLSVGYPTMAGGESEHRVANPGWQPDPTGRHGLRYHDGIRWTEHVADAGVQAYDPVTPSPPMVGNPTGPWGVSGWGFPQTREHPNGSIILVFGILGIVVCGLLGPVAWVMGSRALSEMNRQPATMWTNRGQVRAGQICGIISTCLLALGVIFVVLILATGGWEGETRHYSSCRATLASAQSASVAYWSDNDTWPRRFSDLTDDFYMTLRADTRETADSTAITNGDWTITMRGGGLRETTFDTVGC